MPTLLPVMAIDARSALDHGGIHKGLGSSHLPRFAWQALRALALLMATASALAQPIVVGRSLPLSGPLQSIGELKRDGADAMIHKVNANGGIGGKRLEIATLDDAYKADTTVANLRRLAAEQRPVAFMSLLRMPAEGNEIPLLNELRIPVVGIASATHLLRERFNRYGFPVRASVTDEGRALARHVKVVGIERMAVIYQDVPLGHATRQSIDTGLKAAGLEARHFALDAAGVQAAEVAQQAVRSQPQAIFLGVLTPAAAALIQELRKLSFGGAIYTFSSTDVVVLTQRVGEQAVGVAISQIVPMAQGARVPVVAEYLQSVKDFGKGRPTMLGLEGFIEAKVLVEGLRRSGPSPTPEGLVKALETLRDFDLGGFFVSYSSQAHTGSLFVEIDMIGPGGKLMR